MILNTTQDDDNSIVKFLTYNYKEFKILNILDIGFKNK